MIQKSLGLLILFSVWGQSVLADGIPQKWQIGLQEPVTPVAKIVSSFHDQVLIMSIAISIFVFILLFVAILRFRETKNPVPSKTTHNPVLEVVWTLIPCVLLTVMLFPSVRLIHYMEKVDDPELTLKIEGHQWYWNYEIPELDISFESRIIPDEELKPGQLRLLEVDEPVVLPVNTKVRLLITSSDVLHSWGVPSFAVKKDGAPGRISESWVNIQKEGVYYGQCSELCGMDHGFMPIKVEAVSKENFLKWANDAKHRL
jgi:cytochrome c oxidase subunit 2